MEWCYLIYTFSIFYLALGADTDFSKPENSSRSINCTEPFLPHECNSAFFYRCVKDQKVLMQCPYQLFFNTEKLVCDWPPEGTCPNNPTGNCHPRSTYFPDRNNPQFFYQCSRGLFYKFQCPVDMIFNFEIGACEFSRKESPVFRPSKPETSRDWVPMVMENSHNVRWPSDNVTQQPAPNRRLVCKWKVVGYKLNSTDSLLKENSSSTKDRVEPMRQAAVTWAPNERKRTTWIPKRPGIPIPINRNLTKPQHSYNSLDYSTPVETNVMSFSGPSVNVSVGFESGFVDIKTNETDIVVHFHPKGSIREALGTLEAKLDLNKDDTNGASDGAVLDIRASALPNEEAAHIRLHLTGGAKF